ncbi:hypothetical protein PIB30_054663 [Stylosanthes scabra]|uniref:Zinc knuckle CX2CX4HX4C domain-containing protein n=1 Tax=Stylosanthes scabra TaxID=79078 RepID=A0ABU6RJH8_9FABA|nr:hypothetical protein [Stylosanthes scabra]
MACVQINLNRPIIDEVEIDDRVYGVAYENLELLCGCCRCFGHLEADCGKKKEKTVLLITTDHDGERQPEALTAEIGKENSNYFEFGKNQIQNNNEFRNNQNNNAEVRKMGDMPSVTLNEGESKSHAILDDENL